MISFAPFFYSKNSRCLTQNQIISFKYLNVWKNGKKMKYKKKLLYNYFSHRISKKEFKNWLTIMISISFLFSCTAHFFLESNIWRIFALGQNVNVKIEEQTEDEEKNNALCNSQFITHILLYTS